MMRRAMRVSVVVEHGNAGAQAAAPMARDIMTEALRRDPANRTEAPPRAGGGSAAAMTCVERQLT